MPELAEVYFNASSWSREAGRRFAIRNANLETRCGRDFDLALWPDDSGPLALLSGHTHGKRMLFLFERSVCLEVHLGMTGSLRVELSGYQRAKYDHLVLGGEQNDLVFSDPRQFGKFELSHSEGLPEWWQSLPPQPHERGFSAKRFEALCERRKGSVVKAFLLMQDCFPGVGNWMADEILWRAEIRPDRRVSSLSEKESDQLYREAKWVCRNAIRIIGRDYSDPPITWLFQHRWKDGGVCPRTKKPLTRETIGGRTTCWSPALQR